MMYFVSVGTEISFLSVFALQIVNLLLSWNKTFFAYA